ncbi:MAG: hemerythrin domain-containing protein [Labilithrix sp.]|nr:hemerythrin domain-containing protein [Labilithrix sp.]MCW5812533.1 hemerythrin domain-containing protein [Labilithrix sp.]
MSDKSPLESVRMKVLRQHAELRARLGSLDRAAPSATSPAARTHLRLSLLRFAAAFEEHLAFEESALVDAMRDFDPWSSVREARLLEEHAEQRDRVERLCAMADEGGVTSAELAGEVHWFTQVLRDDMVEEESRLADLIAIEEHGLEQMTG